MQINCAPDKQSNTSIQPYKTRDMLSFTNMKGWFDANFDTAHLTLVSSGSDVG